MRQEPGTGLSPRLVLALGAALVAGHLYFSLAVNVPGYLTWDSGTYHLMVKTLAETGGFVVDNGYDEIASPELVVGQLRAPAGRLVAQYPEIFTLFALPFYLALGWPGVFFLEAVAFLGVVGLLYLLAHRLFDDHSLALGAVAIYVFATFAWEYSQSSYPHLLATFLVLAGFYAMVRAWRDPEGSPRTRWAFAAGLAGGLAIGVRLDSLFALPALGLPLLLSRPARWRELFATGFGLIPGLAFLSWVNRAKFGTWNPITYGITDEGGANADLRWYIPAVIAGVLVVASLAAWRWRQRWLPVIARRRRDVAPWVWIGGSAGIVLTLGLLFPSKIGELVHGVYQIVVDMRGRPEIPEAALARSANGAMIYMGGVKKSLLQSLPYLALLYVPIIAATRASTSRRAALWALFAVPACYLGVFGSLAWHGSVALNMRYLNPILPFTSILAAWVWRRLEHKPSPGRSLGYAGLFGLVFFVAFAGPKSIETQETLFLSLPLMLTACVAVLELATRVEALRAAAGRWLPIFLLASFAYSGAVTLARDYPTSAAQRSMFLRLALAMEPHVRDGSLVFLGAVDMGWGLLDRVDGVRLARPAQDEYRSFPRLAHRHLESGRGVFMTLGEEAVRVDEPAFARIGLRYAAAPVELGFGPGGRWFLVELVYAEPAP